MALRALGVVKQIIESIGMSVSYAHDDLVFMEHNAFLLQFTSAHNKLLIHMNKDADAETVGTDITRLQDAATGKDISFSKGGLYKLSQTDDENISIEFF